MQEALDHQGGTVGSWCLVMGRDGFACSDSEMRLRDDSQWGPGHLSAHEGSGL